MQNAEVSGTGKLQLALAWSIAGIPLLAASRKPSSMP